MIKILEDVNDHYEKFFKQHGIEKKTNCTGFSEKEQKWYGWSHRAIYGFGIGDKCKEGQVGVGDDYKFKPGDILKTLDDCKQRAEDFAKSIA